MASATSRLRLITEGEERHHEYEESAAAAQSTHRSRRRFDRAFQSALKPVEGEVRVALPRACNLLQSLAL